MTPLTVQPLAQSLKHHKTSRIWVCLGIYSSLPSGGWTLPVYKHSSNMWPAPEAGLLSTSPSLHEILGLSAV